MNRIHGNESPGQGSITKWMDRGVTLSEGYHLWERLGTVGKGVAPVNSADHDDIARVTTGGMLACVENPTAG